MPRAKHAVNKSNPENVSTGVLAKAELIDTLAAVKTELLLARSNLNQNKPIDVHNNLRTALEKLELIKQLID